MITSSLIAVCAALATLGISLGATAAPHFNPHSEVSNSHPYHSTHPRLNNANIHPGRGATGGGIKPLPWVRGLIVDPYPGRCTSDWDQALKARRGESEGTQT